MALDEAREVGPEAGLLERNLQALGRCSPEMAGLIAQTPARPDARFETAADGGITGQIGDGPGARRLASARRPLDEAARLAERVDPTESGVVVLQGFGVGHHVAAVAERLGRTGVVLVYEPDAGLLRAVLERVNLVAAFESANIAVLSRADAGAISRTLQGSEVVVSLGVKIIEHGPSMPRLGEEASRFAEAFTKNVRAIRTNVVTTLMQTETSLRNGLMNLDYYASVPGVAELTGCARGRPAVVVSAGPSLHRNMELLAQSGVRDRVVIVAVQTVLRQLLEAGIRPHFVTALDYHEISARFYEGLTEQDVEGVTLVVEPKANPAILSAFPGAIRCVHDAKLGEVLGAGFMHDGAGLEPGATVAHMAYTLARYMGCDPVMLVGQDLGFTDGQYYGPRAAIHKTWAGELNEFNTLEMMEWQRVVRNRAHLHAATDHLGRPVYTDEQMSAYLVHFERMFEADAGKGLTTIDATEGGVAKRCTTVAALRDALETYAGESCPTVDVPCTVRDDGLREATAPRVADRLGSLGRDVARIAELSRSSVTMLREMRDNLDDQARVNRLIARVHAHGEEVQGLGAAYRLVQHLNQTGQFKRFKADRLIHLQDLGGELTAHEKQARQIERDVVNVEWLAESAEQLGGMLAAAAKAMVGHGPRLTRDPEEHGRAEVTGGRLNRRRVAAIIPVDTQRGGLGTVRNLAWPITGGRNALQLTLGRLVRCGGLDRVVLLTEQPEQVRRLIGDERQISAGRTGGPTIEIEQTEGHPLGERRHGIAAARAFAGDCWRGGLCGMTVWDEAICPTITLEAMDNYGVDAAVVVGADWAMVDPDLTDAVIERYREDPERRKLTFTQAAPGLSPCVLDRTLVEELATNETKAGGFASIGGLLGYVPRAATLDPIAKPGCVRIDPALRDIGVRLIADSIWRGELVGRVHEFGGAELGHEARAAAEALAARGPGHLTLELCPGRRTGGELAQLISGGRSGLDREVLTVCRAVRVIEELAAVRPDAVLTLGGAGDPLMHGRWRDVVSAARSAGLAGVHVRTDLQCEPDEAVGLLESGATIVSVDLLAETPETYRSLAGVASFERARDNLVALLEARQARTASGMPDVWVVPRITRCDRVYTELESFYDRWLTVAQACVIDPLPRRAKGERIAPLPEPGLAKWRRAVSELTVLSDGRALAKTRRRSGRSSVNALEEGLAEAWARVLRARLERSRLTRELRGRSSAAVAAAA